MKCNKTTKGDFLKTIANNVTMKGAVFQWLNLILIGVSLGIASHSEAAQSTATSMKMNVGSSSGSVGNLALANDSKIVNLYTNGSGNLSVNFNFPASGLSTSIEMSAYFRQKRSSDTLTFQALNTSGAYVNLNNGQSTAGSTSFKTIKLALPSNVVVGGTIAIRVLSNPGANDFVFDQLILADSSSLPPPPPPADLPLISSFTASQTNILAGASTTLSWNVSGATSLSINPGSISIATSVSSLIVTPAASTNYTLTATNSVGSVSKSISITVGTISTSKTIPAGTKWYWQLQGAINMNVNAKVYDIDLYDTSAATIESLKVAGHTVICYYSAGTYEDWRSDASNFPASALGTNVDGWAGEKWIDIRRSEIRDIMSARMDIAKTKGCDGLEPDNVDGYTQKSGFTLTAADQIAYNKFLADAAHARGMIVALKNTPDLVANLVNYFDFSVAEECFKYNECSMYSPFIKQNKAVLSAEYTSYSSSTCTKAAGLNLSTVFFNLNLDGKVFSPCP